MRIMSLRLPRELSATLPQLSLNAGACRCADTSTRRLRHRPRSCELKRATNRKTARPRAAGKIYAPAPFLFLFLFLFLDKDRLL